MAVERRRWRRYRVEDAFLTCQPVQQGFSLKKLFSRPREETYPVIDVSMTGSMFRSTREFPRNELFPVALRIPPLKEALKMKAAVRRVVNRPSDPGVHWVAVRFMEFEADAKDRLRKCLENKVFRMLSEKKVRDSQPR